MAIPKANKEAVAFLGLARTLRAGEAEREKVIRPFRQRYDRSQGDPRMSPDQRARIAAEFVRAALYADHLFTDCIEDGQQDYRRVVLGSGESHPPDSNGKEDAPIV
jgi:hypothetical protein